MKTTLTELAVSKLKPPEKGQVTYFDNNLRGFGLRISQGGTKTWIVVHGKDRRLITLGRYPELTLKDARIRAKLTVATSKPRIPGVSTPLYSEASKSFLEARKGKNKPTTLRLYTTYLNFFDFKKKIDQITREDIKEKLKELKGKATAQNVAQNVLRTFLVWAMKEELIDRNVLSRVDAPNKLKSRDRVLSDEELVKIWNACEGNYGRIVRVLMLTGARRSEISRYGEGTTHFHFVDTKNNRSHTLPITPLVREQLPVLPCTSWSPEKVKLDERSGVTNWRLHDLRRSFSTNCARHKVPIHITEKILNHVQGSVSEIAKIYMRWEFEEEVREALLTHEAFILRMVKPEGTFAQAGPSTVPLKELSDEQISQQKGTASGNHTVDPTHHP